MPSKTIEVAGIGPVVFTKRRAARSIKLSISGGMVKVSLPLWTPYASAVPFVVAKSEWVHQHLATQAPRTLVAGQQIGKAHRLHFAPGNTIGSRITGNAVTITYPPGLKSDDAAVQAKATQAAMRALRQEALALLPARVAALATTHGYQYGTISVKHLKRRWGSCDQDRNLTFNLFLMDMPWELIDYVILHELNHTRHMDHSAAFWDSLEDKVVGLTDIRKRMREHQPIIGA